MQYFEVSAKTGENVSEMFTSIAKDMNKPTILSHIQQQHKSQI